MIPRYSRPEMVAIWSPETKFRIWFEIEAHAATQLANLGVIPAEAAKVIWEKGSAATFDVARIDEIELTTKHDMIAFLTHLAEIVGPEARFVHQGMTSSDVVDTTLPNGVTAQFPIEGFARYCLLNGVDELGFLLKQAPAIERYEAAHPAL